MRLQSILEMRISNLDMEKPCLTISEAEFEVGVGYVDCSWCSLVSIHRTKKFQCISTLFEMKEVSGTCTDMKIARVTVSQIGAVALDRDEMQPKKATAKWLLNKQ